MADKPKPKPKPQIKVNPLFNTSMFIKAVADVYPHQKEKKKTK